jgi:hypothetical protein
MADPGCHWFRVNGKNTAKLVVNGPTAFRNLDEAALIVKGNGSTRNVAVGKTLAVSKPGSEAVTFAPPGQAGSTNLPPEPEIVAAVGAEPSTTCSVTPGTGAEVWSTTTPGSSPAAAGRARQATRARAPSSRRGVTDHEHERPPPPVCQVPAVMGISACPDQLLSFGRHRQHKRHRVKPRETAVGGGDREGRYS